MENEDVKQDPITEDKTEDISNNILENINYKDLFLVKGKPGIYISSSRGPSKQNMVGLRLWDEIFNPSARVSYYKMQDLTNLGSVVFYAQEEVKDAKGKKQIVRKTLSIKDVFVNFSNFEDTMSDDIGIEDLDTNNPDTLANLMEIAVPNYDPDEFKSYHLKKVVKWYKKVKDVIFKIFETKEKDND